jgi:glycosyltransferase involved in cell wall biosynthesis
MKPVLFVTGHAPPDRVGAFARLAELEHVEFALFGGRLRHATAAQSELPFPHRYVRQRELLRLAAGGRHRALVCSTGGRVALPLSWTAARAARIPVILWSSLWAHPRSAAHAASYLALRRGYRAADAVVTYGPHVSAYVKARGARNVYVAPQSVDNAFWQASCAPAPVHPAWPSGSEVKFLFVGRPATEKGLPILLSAWRSLEIPPSRAALVLAGVPAPDRKDYERAKANVEADDGVAYVGWLPPAELRNFYAASDVLVLPSIPTRTFREPWGLVVNEAFNQQLPVIVSDAVGAAAGGLVRDGANGFVVPAADASALAASLRRLGSDPELRRRMGRTGARDVRAYTHEAWAEGFSQALVSLGLSRKGTGKVASSGGGA